MATRRVGQPLGRRGRDRSFRNRALALLDAVLESFSLPDTRTTVLQDWDKGRHSEVDEINGLVVQTQKLSARSAPANERTVKVAHQIEAGEIEARPENVALLLAD
jgi:2-dehydropantoate 2-reductase